MGTGPSAQPETFQGKGDFVGLGHFYKLFVKNTREKGPAGKSLEIFTPRYSKTTFCVVLEYYK